LNEDILSLILQAENEYHAAMKKTAEEAEGYADGRKKEQDAYIEGLKRDWHLFEESENKKLAEMFEENEKKLETEAAELKKRLIASQKKKADLISGRLKKEVISLIWQ